MSRSMINVKLLSAVSIAFLLIFIFTHLSAVSSNTDSSSSFQSPASISRKLSKNVKPYMPHMRSPPAPKPANATLDFQEILYISMPYRTDRQDALSLIAATTGLKLTLIPGVDASAMHHKSHPPGIPEEMRNASSLGVWRAHANAWRYVIDNNLSSALILEDDADWDMNIKTIMGLYNWQLRYNNTVRWGRGNEEKGWDEECAYGCDWDELFVGQCGNLPNKARLDLHYTYHDPDSPAISTHQDNIQEEVTKLWNYSSTDEGLRIVSPTYGPLCNQGYAVSRMGAIRMLYQIGGWHGMGMGVDNEIAFRSQDGYISGYTLTPPVFASWRTGGGRDSDNDANIASMAVQSEGELNVRGRSYGIKKSAKKSLGEVLDKKYWVERENDRAGETERMREEILVG